MLVMARLLKKQKDEVKCSICGNVLQRRHIVAHWKMHAKKQPIHPSDVAFKDMSLDIIFDELDVNIDVDLKFDDNLKADHSDSDEDVFVSVDNIQAYLNHPEHT